MLCTPITQTAPAITKGNNAVGFNCRIRSKVTLTVAGGGGGGESGDSNTCTIIRDRRLSPGIVGTTITYPNIVDNTGVLDVLSKCCEACNFGIPNNALNALSSLSPTSTTNSNTTCDYFELDTRLVGKTYSLNSSLSGWCFVCEIVKFGFSRPIPKA